MYLIYGHIINIILVYAINILHNYCITLLCIPTIDDIYYRYIHTPSVYNKYCLHVCLVYSP